MKHIATFQIGTSGSATRGGLERYYFDLVRALPAAGVTVSGLVVGDSSGQCDGAPAISAFAKSSDSMLKRWSNLRTDAPPRIAEADIVVSHFAPYAFPLLDCIWKKPFVVHFHGPWALESKAEAVSAPKIALRRLVERVVYATGNSFITLSTSFADVLSNNYGVDRDRIRVIRGGVDLSRFAGVLGSREEARIALGWPTDRRIILSVRRLVPSKGLEGLIDASAVFHRTDPDALVIIVGSGPLAEQLQHRIDALDASNYVRLVGGKSDEDLVRAYRAADMTIVPSIAYEGFGLVVIESLACGTPVMVTNIGGLPETIIDFEPKLVLNGSDCDAIVNGLMQIASGELSLPTTDRCIEYAQRFDWNNVSKDIAAAYYDAIR